MAKAKRPAEEDAVTAPESKKQRKDEEKRLRRFRAKAPANFHEVYDRAQSQRFYVLSRTRMGTEECPSERIELTGSTGNIYSVTIDRQPVCDCPHGKKGNQCKHWLFIMSKVLNAPSHHVYQLALLSIELREIFEKAPPIPDATQSTTTASAADDKKRKPVEGDCPICYSEFNPDSDEITWCRAACGQNMHKDCFNMWAMTKGSVENATCPMCRSRWEDDNPQDKVKRLERAKGSMSEGYVNVAGQLGISGVRDHSSYSEWWGRPRRGRGGRGGGGGGWKRRDYWAEQDEDEFYD